MPPQRKFDKVGFISDGFGCGSVVFTSILNCLARFAFGMPSASPFGGLFKYYFIF